MTVSRWCCLLLVVATAGSGCHDPNRPVKVAGQVTLNGVPVEGAVVSLVPEDGRGRPALAWTRADGRFDLNTISDDDGALRGNYVVTISKLDSPAVSGDSTPGEEATSVRRGKALLPAGYGDPATSPFRCTVPTNGPLILELTSDGPPRPSQ